MRNYLKKFNAETKTFSGIFKKVGTFRNRDGEWEHYGLFEDIKDQDNKTATSHVWIDLLYFKGIDLSVGCRLNFVGTIAPYLKGYDSKNYNTKTIDYTIYNLEQIQKVA